MNYLHDIALRETSLKGQCFLDVPNKSLITLLMSQMSKVNNPKSEIRTSPSNYNPSIQQGKIEDVGT